MEKQTGVNLPLSLLAGDSGGVPLRAADGPGRAWGKTSAHGDTLIFRTPQGLRRGCKGHRRGQILRHGLGTAGRVGGAWARAR